MSLKLKSEANAQGQADVEQTYQSPPRENSPDTITADRTGPEAVRRGPWSPSEDKRLMNIIALHGPSNWVRISLSIKTRSPKQCRERYHQNLKPSLNRHPITEEEGVLIERLVKLHGKKWAEISRHLPGRSDNAIKNWWNGGANRRRRSSNSHEQIPQKFDQQGVSMAVKPHMVPATHTADSHQSHVYAAYSQGYSHANRSEGVVPVQPHVKKCYTPMLHTPEAQSMMPPSYSGYLHYETAQMPRYIRTDLSPKCPQSSPTGALNAVMPNCVSSLTRYPQVAFNTGIFRKRSPQGFHHYSHSNSSESIDSNPSHRASSDHMQIPTLHSMTSVTPCLDCYTTSSMSPSTLPSLTANFSGDLSVSKPYDSWGYGGVGAINAYTSHYDYRGHNPAMTSKSGVSSTYTSRRPSSANEARSSPEAKPEDCCIEKNDPTPGNYYKEAASHSAPRRNHINEANLVVPPFEHLMRSINSTPILETSAGTGRGIEVSRLIN